MSIKIQTWAWGQKLKTGPKLTLMALADESNDQGMVFLSREKLAAKIAGIKYETATAEELDNATRALRRTMKTLIDENYVMTGRRQRKWSRGRAVDVIFLNVRGVEGVSLYDSRDDIPGELPNPFLLNEPVDNSAHVLPDKMSDKRVLPSQDLEDKMSGKTSEQVLTGQKGTSYRTKRDVLPDKSGHEKTGALIGTRARLTLNNPTNPQSVSQSLNPSEPVEKFLADGRTNRPEQDTPKPEITPVPAPNLTATEVYRGVSIPKAAAYIQRETGRNLSTLKPVYWQQIITIILDRAADTGAPIKRPQAYVQKAIATELDSLLSQAITAINPIEAPQPHQEPSQYCLTHQHHYRGVQCPLCALDARIAATHDEQEVDPQEGIRFRDEIRARRNAKIA